MVNLYDTYLMSGPDTSPCKHGLTSMLDLGSLQELLVGEHAGKGIKGFTFAQGVKTQRIPNGLVGHFQGRLDGRRSLLRDKGGGASHKGGEDGNSELGHG